MQLSKSQEQNMLDQKELEKANAALSQRNSQIIRLKDEIKKRDIELDCKDEETMMQVTQLNLIV